MNRFVLLALFGGIFLCLSCSRQAAENSRNESDQSAQSNNPVLAVVGDQRITLKDFQAELSRRSRLNHGAYVTEKQQQQLLQDMVRFDVLLQRAKASGFDRSPEIQAQVNEFIVSRFVEDRLAAEAAPPPGDAEVRQFFDLHSEQFTTPAAVKVALIYFKCSSKATVEKREEMKQQAEAVLAAARATDAGGFSRLAQQHSDDQSTRYHGGDIGWLQQDAALLQWDAAISKAAFAISQPGACAPLVEAPEGFYIIRLEQKRAGGVRPFDQVKEGIAYQLAQTAHFQRQEDFYQNMQQGIKIEIHPEALKSSSPAEQAAESRPPSLPKS